MTSCDFLIACEQWLAPRPLPLQRSTALVKKRERAILSLFRASRRHHRHIQTRIPCTPQLTQPDPAHLQSRLFRSFAEVGSKGDGRNAKAERVAVEAREHVSFTSLRPSSPDSQAVRLRETHPKTVARGVQRSGAIGENCLAALLQANAFTVIYAPWFSQLELAKMTVTRFVEQA